MAVGLPRPRLSHLSRRLLLAASRRTAWLGGASWREACVLLAGLTAVTLAMMFPLVKVFGSALPGDLGDPVLAAWTLGWDADRMRHGLRGLWDAPIFFPYTRTLAFSEHLLGVAIFSAPVQWLTGNVLAAYNFAFLFSYVLAGAGMYLLARSLTGRRDAAALAALAFAFVPYRASQMSHLQVLFSGWMPIALWALHRYFASGSRRALAAFTAAFVLQAGSNLYFMYFFTVPVFLVGCYELVRARSGFPARRLLELAAAAAVILLLLAPIAWVYLGVRHEHGFVRSPGEQIDHSADLHHYLRIYQGNPLWRQILGHGPHERDLFPGLTFIALVSVGLAGWRQRKAGPRTGLVALYAAVSFAGILLTLGPQPRAWGVRVLPFGPFTELEAVLPGLDGTRVPARFAIIVYLAFGVLAAFGASAILRRLSGARRFIVWGMIAGMILAEGYAPVNCEPVARHSAAYAWLARSSPGAVVELPFLDIDGVPTTLSFQLGTLEHRHPIVNGYSGYVPALTRFLGGQTSPFWVPTQVGDALRGLRALGVRYLVFHALEYDSAEFAGVTLASIRAEPEQISGEWTFDDRVTIFQLAPAAPLPDRSPGLTRIPPDRFEATASRMPDRLAQAFDGNPATRWLTASRQIGDERIDIRFRETRDVALLTFEMGPSTLGDYPRGLVIESSSSEGGAGPFRTLYAAGVLPQLMQGILRSGARPAIEIPLAVNATRTLRLRQTGETRAWHWSIPELTLWERTGPLAQSRSQLSSNRAK